MSSSLELYYSKIPPRLKGQFHYEFPEDLGDGVTAYANNINGAARLFLLAETPEEMAIASLVFQLTTDLEVSQIMDSVVGKISSEVEKPTEDKV